MWLLDGLFGGLVLFVVTEAVAAYRRSLLRQSLLRTILLELKAQHDILVDITKWPHSDNATGLPTSTWLSLRTDAALLLPTATLAELSAHYSYVECRELWVRTSENNISIHTQPIACASTSCLLALRAVAKCLRAEVVTDLIGDVSALAPTDGRPSKR